MNVWEIKNQPDTLVTDWSQVQFTALLIIRI